MYFYSTCTLIVYVSFKLAKSGIKNVSKVFFFLAGAELIKKTNELKLNATYI